MAGIIRDSEAGASGAGIGGRWRRLSVGTKVVAPFVGLTVLLGLVVSAVAGQELAVLGGQQQLIVSTRAEDNVNTVFNSVEERQLAELRLLAAAPGLSDAVAAGDGNGSGTCSIRASRSSCRSRAPSPSWTAAPGSS